MTEQNTAYRNEFETEDENDPLAELARIVSGEPSSSKSEGKPVELAEVTSKPDGSGFDIESELMKELGGMSDAANDPAELPEFEISDEDFAAELQAEGASNGAVNPESGISSQSLAASAQEVSLEDQLMAELDGQTVVEGSPVVDTNPLVEETVSNAMRDVEMAQGSLENASSTDDHSVERIEQLADEMEREALTASNNAVEPAASNMSADAAPDQSGLVEDMFAEGFEDLLQEEMKASEQAKPAMEMSGAANQEPDLEIDFAEAFAAELENGDAAQVTPPMAGMDAAGHPVSPQQDELALENDFAKAFESELNSDVQSLSSETHMGFSDQPNSEIYPDNQHIEPEMASSDHIGVIADQPQRGGNGFKLAVGALACALAIGLAVVGWGYYSGQGGAEEPAVIKADATPAKVKPEDPGGEEIANQDNEVYNQVAGNSVKEPSQEDLISSRQQPVDVPAKAESRLSPDTGDNQASSAPLGLSPKRVKTLTVKPDGTIIASDGEVAALAGARTSDNISPASENTTADTETTDTNGNVVGIDGASSTGTLAIPQPSPLPEAQAVSAAAVSESVAPKPVAAKPAPAPATTAAEPASDNNAPTQIASLDNAPAPTPVATSSEWKIQVSSQRSREAAESSFNNLQRRFSSILGGRSAVIQRADIDGKGTFYRAKVLAESKDEATRLCSRLKGAGGSCFVTR